jgi:sugar O-acyltransferase (sialic acid O-acetyltransferase NeuD family)
MRTLLVLGAGGHGRVVADAALAAGPWEAVCFVDDRPGLTEALGFRVVGAMKDLDALASQYTDAVAAIGHAPSRLTLLQRCKHLGLRTPPIIHPSATVSRFAAIGDGSVVLAQAAINSGVVVGRACIINTGATVDHDCELRDGVHICPGANLAGNVHAGERAWIGIGSCVRQGVTIGADVMVGAGAAVVSNVEPGLTVVGVPARPIGNKV